MGSCSLTWDQTSTPALGRELNGWTTREVPCGPLIRSLWLHWAHPVIQVMLSIARSLIQSHPQVSGIWRTCLRVQLLCWPHPVSTDGVWMSRWLVEGMVDVLLFGFWYRPPLMNALCEANCTFAFNLLKMLAEEDHSWHVFFSPLSLSFVLTMVLMGAEGNTVAQMSQVCGLPLCSHRARLFLLYIGWWKPVRPGDWRGPEVMERMQTWKWQGELCEMKPPASAHGMHWVLYAASLISKGNCNSIPQKSQEFQLCSVLNLYRCYISNGSAFM